MPAVMATTMPGPSTVQKAAWELGHDSADGLHGKRECVAERKNRLTPKIIIICPDIIVDKWCHATVDECFEATPPCAAHTHTNTTPQLTEAQARVIGRFVRRHSQEARVAFHASTDPCSHAIFGHDNHIRFAGRAALCMHACGGWCITRAAARVAFFAAIITGRMKPSG